MTQDNEAQPGLLRRHWPKAFLALLGLYLILLGIGVAAEMFDIQSVLDWWLWRPPGR